MFGKLKLPVVVFLKIADRRHQEIYRNQKPPQVAKSDNRTENK